MRLLYTLGVLALIGGGLPTISSHPHHTPSTSTHDSFASILKIAQSRIKHIVILMMENRSFDHLLGWLHSDYDNRIEGLTEGMRVPRDPQDLSKGYVEIGREGYDVGPDDPLHDFDNTHIQIDNLAMDGFVYNALQWLHNETNPVAMFDTTSAPIINGLAKEFAVFDHWHCSLPGPTDPNRAYAMSGTSRGVVHNFDLNLWQQQSYFDLLTQHNHTWTAYYQQDLWEFGYFQDMWKPENSQHIKDLDSNFWNDVANGSLPEFTWLQPRMLAHTELPTWQHPDASISAGEQLYNHVYTALRTSPIWNETLFILTYDEHGGFLDHVPPPTGVPNPDGMKAPNGFNFDELGIRVPTIAISPWIPKGTIISSALPHERPTNTSQFDSTSIMATTHALLGLTEAKIPLLGARAAWASTFIGLVTTLNEPRTDCPITMGETILDIMDDSFYQSQLIVQRSKPIHHHLYNQLAFYCQQLYPHMGHTCEGLSSHITQNQGTASDWIVKQHDILMARVRATEREYFGSKMEQA